MRRRLLRPRADDNHDQGGQQRIHEYALALLVAPTGDHGDEEDARGEETHRDPDNAGCTCQARTRLYGNHLSR
jgi:hypothetical protein